jgi:hypothetical protein
MFPKLLFPIYENIFDLTKVGVNKGNKYLSISLIINTLNIH